MDRNLLADRLRPRLEFLYGDKSEDCLSSLLSLAESYASTMPVARRKQWDQSDVVLITYGDQILSGDEPTLRTLLRFLRRHEMKTLTNIVHILPFCPYSSDDGFSVIDYKQINPILGDWHDIQHLCQNHDLMADLVLNHISARSEWFQKYLQGEQPFTSYFIEERPDTDLREVVRPRSLPLLTRFETSRGPKHVWTTFSDDQIDLNFANPDVLIHMVDVLLFYLQQSSRIIRLDAIAFLWKKVGTSCLHLPETHEVVKLFRDIIDAVAPHRILLTETNVPHVENISYFGEGDEAQMVYQFSLAPLLLDAYYSEDTRALQSWASTSCTTAPGTTYLNFTASHDGIGVRPLQGLVPDERMQSLIGEVHRRGGHVSTRRLADGSDSPYELNITYYSALELDHAPTPREKSSRFLASQAIMLAMRGIPAVYFHSLMGTPNDHESVAHTGRVRSINRRKYNESELEKLLDDYTTPQALNFEEIQRLIALRREQPAFHPEAFQQIFEIDNPFVFAFLRKSETQEIVVAANVTGRSQTVILPTSQSGEYGELLSGAPVTVKSEGLTLDRYQVVWLVKLQ